MSDQYDWVMGTAAAPDQYYAPEPQPIEKAPPIPFEGPMPQAEMRSYTPTYRDNARARLMGDDPSNTRRVLVDRFVGTPDRVGLLDFIPGGGLPGAQEEWRKGNYSDAAIAAIPILGAGRKLAKGASAGMGAIANVADYAAPAAGHNRPPKTGVDFWSDPTPANYGDIFIQPGDTRVSTRFPKDVQPTLSDPSGFVQKENPLRQHLSVGVDEFLNKSSPEQLAHNMGLIADYPGFAHLKGMQPEEQVRSYLDQVKGNLRYVWDQSPKVMQQRSPIWYEGANEFTDALAGRYGVPRPAASGGTAVLSPQKDWFQNASLSERVGDIVTGANKKWDPDMLRYARESDTFSKEKNWAIVQRIAGKSLDQIDDPLERAAFVRLWDEVRNPRHFREITPEGRFGDFVRNEDGTPAKVAWGSGSEVAKAIQMYESQANMDIVSRLLGSKHKVRSFYNNLEVPFDTRFGDVTSDTHQVAAGLLRPLSGNTPEVAHNFGSSLAKEFQPEGYKGTMNSAVTGLQGTYPLQVEATRELARDLGVKHPRGVQSGVWEPVRTLFSDTFKSNPKNIDDIDNIWRAYDRKQISLEQARRAVFERAGGIEQPSWARPGLKTSDPKRSSTYR